MRRSGLHGAPLTNPSRAAINRLMQPSPAAPSFEPPLPISAGDSSRRILWIVGLYRAVCGAGLLGIALLLDLKALGITEATLFLTSAAVYFAFGLATFWWIQRDPLPLPLTALTSILLVGDVGCIAAVMVSGGTSGGTLPILLFPQLAASGWLLRTRTAFLHAGFATLCLLALDVWRLVEGQVNFTQPVQTGLIGFGFFATVGVAIALGAYTKASEDLAAQRGIDVANLEQVNRLIIQDMRPHAAGRGLRLLTVTDAELVRRAAELGGRPFLFISHMGGGGPFVDIHQLTGRAPQLFRGYVSLHDLPYNDLWRRRYAQRAGQPDAVDVWIVR